MFKDKNLTSKTPDTVLAWRRGGETNDLGRFTVGAAKNDSLLGEATTALGDKPSIDLEVSSLPPQESKSELAEQDVLVSQQGSD